MRSSGRRGCRTLSFSEAFFQRASDAAWCEVGVDDGEQPTFAKQGSSYQLDHLFVDTETFADLQDVKIDHDVLSEGISDRAPIVADFRLPPRELVPVRDTEQLAVLPPVDSLCAQHIG